jgi:hypothetical protein
MPGATKQPNHIVKHIDARHRSGIGDQAARIRNYLVPFAKKCIKLRKGRRRTVLTSRRKRFERFQRQFGLAAPRSRLGLLD